MVWSGGDGKGRGHSWGGSDGLSSLDVITRPVRLMCVFEGGGGGGRGSVLPAAVQTTSTARPGSSDRRTVLYSFAVFAGEAAEREL